MVDPKDLCSIYYHKRQRKKNLQYLRARFSLLVDKYFLTIPFIVLDLHMPIIATDNSFNTHEMFNTDWTGRTKYSNPAI